ncbi:DUF2953 domain-containing protein [Paenibacillus sp. TRM 82003]|nr:DUF2953 domain-containing protein [Paenibacillus sp. TRM 82003]
MWWWIAGLIGLAAVIAVLLSNIHVRIKYFREGENDEVDATLRALFGLVRLRYKVPTIELKPMLRGFRMKVSQKDTSSMLPTLDFTREELQTFLARARRLISNMKNAREWIMDTMHHVHVSELRWKTRFGLGDAAETGMASGVVWSMKSAMVGVFSKMMTLDQRPDLQVDPRFGEKTFRTDVSARFRVRVIRTFVIGGMLLYRVLRQKGGWKVWFRVLARRPAPGK